MLRNNLIPRTNFPTPLTLRDLRTNRSWVRERNSNAKLDLKSVDRMTLAVTSTGVSQRRLRETYPALLSNLRESGNRSFDPLRHFQSICPYLPNDPQIIFYAMEMIKETLQTTLPLSPLSPNFGRITLLDRMADNMRNAIRNNDPYELLFSAEQLLELLRVFNILTGSLGGYDPLSPIYPGSSIKSGLGPEIQSFIRDVALQFLPLIADLEAPYVYHYISEIDNLMGHSTGGVRRLVQDLRYDELQDLLAFVDPLAQSGDALAEQIVYIILGLPADPQDLINVYRWRPRWTAASYGV